MIAPPVLGCEVARVEVDQVAALAAMVVRAMVVAVQEAAGRALARVGEEGWVAWVVEEGMAEALAVVARAGGTAAPVAMAAAMVAVEKAVEA